MTRFNIFQTRLFFILTVSIICAILAIVLKMEYNQVCGIGALLIATDAWVIGSFGLMSSNTISAYIIQKEEKDAARSNNQI